MKIHVVGTYQNSYTNLKMFQSIKNVRFSEKQCTRTLDLSGKNYPIPFTRYIINASVIFYIIPQWCMSQLEQITQITTIYVDGSFMSP